MLDHIDPYINPSIVVIEHDLPVKDCLEIMIAQKISSVLVAGKDGIISGIITERDIVRKFSLLDVKDKLSRAAGTLMTRPVKFARKDSLFEDVLHLHLEMKIRHFPILTEEPATEENIAGMLSVTDVLRFLLKGGNEVKSIEEEVKEVPIVPIALMTNNPKLAKNYSKIFSQLRYDINLIDDFGTFLKETDNYPHLIFDLDSYSGLTRNNLIPIVLKYPGKLLVVTSNSDALSAMRKFTDKTKQATAIKPLDFGYINWLIREKWSEEG